MTHLTNYTAHPNVTHLPEAPRVGQRLTEEQLAVAMLAQAKRDNHKPGLPGKPKTTGHKKIDGERAKANAAKVLEALREGPGSSIDIASRVGLTKPTVKAVIRRLREDGHTIHCCRKGQRHWFELEEQSA